MEKQRALIVNTGTYCPKCNIEYPADCTKAMLQSNKLYDICFDENYPYLDWSFKAILWRAIIHLGINTLVRLLHPLVYGLKIKGRHNLHKDKLYCKNGAMTICNHVYRWDFLAILQAVNRNVWVLAKKENLMGKDRNLILGAGGIPIPTGANAMQSFYKALDTLHEKKQWIHVFPEGSRWQYYQPIRPFNRGAFAIAYKYRMPIIPMAFSYRQATGIHKIFCHNMPLITLNIGEALLFDYELSSRKAITQMLQKANASVVKLAGIKQNPHPAQC